MEGQTVVESEIVVQIIKFYRDLQYVPNLKGLKIILTTTVSNCCLQHFSSLWASRWLNSLGQGKVCKYRSATGSPQQIQIKGCKFFQPLQICHFFMRSSQIGGYNLQSWTFDCVWSLNNPYVNGVTLREQNQSLKCCQSLESC